MKLLKVISSLLFKIKYILFFSSLLFIFSLFSEAKEISSSINLKCLSCHSIESIRKGNSKIDEKFFHNSVRVNLTKTCGQANCHPGMPDNITRSKIHTNGNERKSGASNNIIQILIWIMFIGWFFILFVVVALTIIGFFLGPLREIIRLKNKFTKIERKQK